MSLRGRYPAARRRGRGVASRGIGIVSYRQPPPSSTIDHGSDGKLKTNPPRILLVDCDSFFVQVARLEDPDGAGRRRLLIVGGTPEGRGVVASASYEARRHGVRSAMPTAKALRLCPEATVVSVARAACVRRSREVRRVLEELAPVVRPASIDEFHLDLSGTERMLAGESFRDTARRIRDTVLARTGISVSAGGGTRRLIAKLATALAKPAGVHIVPAGEEAEFMRRFDLEDIPGIGPAFLAELERRSLRSVPDVLRVQPEWLERWFGARRARWLGDRVRGRDGEGPPPARQRKSVSVERTFATDLSDDDELNGVLARQVGSVARRVRRLAGGARTITVKIRDRDFATRQRSRTLRRPVESDQAMLRVARQLLAELRSRRRTPARLLGVAASGFPDEEGDTQLTFLAECDDADSDRAKRISRVMDLARDRFGEDALGIRG